MTAVTRRVCGCRDEARQGYQRTMVVGFVQFVVIVAAGQRRYDILQCERSRQAARHQLDDLDRCSSGSSWRRTPRISHSV